MNILEMKDFFAPNPSSLNRPVYTPVNQNEAIDLFNSLMGQSSHYSSQNIYSLVSNYQIDYDSVVKMIPPDMLAKAYLGDGFLEECNTFLNKMLIHGLESVAHQLRLDTLEYVVKNSNVKEMFSFDFYLRYMPGTISGHRYIKFNSSTLEYFLDNQEWDEAQQPKLLWSDGTGVATLQSYVYHLSLLAHKNHTPEDIRQTYLSDAQLKKLILNSSPSSFQPSRVRQYVLEAQAQNAYFTPEILELIVKNLPAKTFEDKRALVCVSSRLLQSENIKGVECMDLIARVHNFDWVEIILKEKNKYLRLSAAGPKFSSFVLKRIAEHPLFDKNEEYRKIFLSFPLGVETIAKADIKKEKERLSQEVDLAPAVLSPSNTSLENKFKI